MDKQYDIKLLTSLDKVFLDGNNIEFCENNYFTMLKGEIFSFQVAYKPLANDTGIKMLEVEIDSPIKHLMHIRSVENVASNYPCHSDTDGNYLKTTAGLYPDILKEIKNNKIKALPMQQKSLWIDITTDKDTKASTYPIKILFKDEQSNVVASVEAKILVYDACLPKQTLLHTEWFHGDCLADYYNVEVFSKRHWEIMESFISCAVKRGCNMLLTPVITPSLDIAFLGERTTIQLVDIVIKNGEYSFNFENLKKWIHMAFSCGIKYLEICHLFTQWGASHSPKIMATEDGEYKQIFGWEVTALDEKYQFFLSKFVPALCQYLKDENIQDKVYFHVSDEPSGVQYEHYEKVKNSILKYLSGFKLIDTVSEYDFFVKSGMEYPIVATTDIEPFLKNNTKNLWAYYCTGQGHSVSNRFMAMPSARNRIIGTQLYKYDIQGFLHWGYNFYNSQFSIEKINPFLVTDAGGAFPSGDSFLVYPGDNGTPIESIRMMVFFNALQDIRAFQLLERLTSKEYVMEIIEGELSAPITFSKYPRSATYIINMRNKINKEIAKHSK